VSSLTFVVVALLSSTLMLVFQALLWIKLRRGGQVVSRPPPISVLKPLKGSDAELYENLAAFAEQRYPRFELVLGAADGLDPALAVAHRLRADYPHVCIQVVSGAPDVGLNPKVSNLAHLAAHARHELLLVSDADVRPDRDYLMAQAAALDDDVGLVHTVLCSTAARRVGAVLDALHLNTWIAPVVATSDRLGHPCVIGKSMLMRRADLERLGGWAAVKDVLAEDYVLGRGFQELGKRVVQSAFVLTNLSPERTLSEFWHRHVRWSQMRYRISPVAYMAELAGLPFVWWSLAMAMSPDWRLLAGLATFYAGQVSLARLLHEHALRVRYIALMPLKDVLMIGIWIMGILKRHVDWRGVRMRIARGSRLSPVTVVVPVEHDVVA